MLHTIEHRPQRGLGQMLADPLGEANHTLRRVSELQIRDFVGLLVDEGGIQRRFTDINANKELVSGLVGSHQSK